MSTRNDSISLSDSGETIRAIGQHMVPFNIPLGVPLVNPLAQKQLRFRKEYKITGITVEEAVTGVLFGNYSSFMAMSVESYSRKRQTRHLVFNPFMKELEHVGRQTTGQIGEMAGRGAATVMVTGLGPVEWHVSVDAGATADRVGMRFVTTAKLFSGHFNINARATAGGVILEDEWTPEGGADMRTNYLAMANLVLLTHPKGFEQIAGELVEEVKRARANGVPYTGEIGPPSINEDE